MFSAQMGLPEIAIVGGLVILAVAAILVWAVRELPKP